MLKRFFESFLKVPNRNQEELQINVQAPVVHEEDSREITPQSIKTLEELLLAYFTQQELEDLIFDIDMKIEDIPKKVRIDPVQFVKYIVDYSVRSQSFLDIVDSVQTIMTEKLKRGPVEKIDKSITIDSYFKDVNDLTVEVDNTFVDEFLRDIDKLEFPSNPGNIREFLIKTYTMSEIVQMQKYLVSIGGEDALENFLKTTDIMLNDNTLSSQILALLKYAENQNLIKELFSAMELLRPRFTDYFNSLKNN